MNYEEMSDFEINRAVFSLRYGYNDKDMNRIFRSGRLDYCNDASNAWPIIDSNNIDIVAKRGHLDNGGAQCNHYYVSHKNKLRAAMIVYLKMNEE